MIKYWLFIGPVSLLFITNFGGLYFSEEYTAEILRSYTGQDPASLDPVHFEAMRIAVRAAALLGAASSFLSIYLFRVMVTIERERLTAFLGIMIGGSLALGTAIPSAPVIAILEGGARLFVGVEGGIVSLPTISTPDMYRYYWHQLF